MSVTLVLAAILIFIIGFITGFAVKWQSLDTSSSLRRGVVSADFTSRLSGSFGGHYEVKILEETEDLYHIKWDDEAFESSRGCPKWIPKSQCKLIEEEKPSKELVK